MGQVFTGSVFVGAQLNRSRKKAHALLHAPFELTAV
jgi:hypothetical protein